MGARKKITGTPRATGNDVELCLAFFRQGLKRRFVYQHDCHATPNPIPQAWLPVRRLQSREQNQRRELVKTD